MATQQTACTLGLLLLLAPTASFARTNILTAGLSTSYDYDHPQYETATPDPQAGTVVAADSRDEDTSSLALTPLLRWNSNSQDDQFELSAAPSIRYDMIESESDWDAALALSYTRSLTRAWRLSAANAFVRSDSYDPEGESTVYVPETESQNTSPELAANRGRSRYWRNTTNVASEYQYEQDSLVRLAFDYEVLRNDESELRSYEDYDRSAVTVTHNHRYTPFWTTGVEASLVRGEYDETVVSAAPASPDETVPAETTGTGLVEELGTSDLWEYHLLAGVENTSFQRNRLGLAYTYVGTVYDEELEYDQDIHELQATWRHEYSQHLTTTLGGGPSYLKTEGQDATWGGNGIAAIDYRLEHGALGLAVEKGYEVDNFSGTDERGVVNFWNTRLYGNYQVVVDVTLTGLLEYRYEDREDPTVAPPTATVDGTDTTLSEYTNKQFTAGGGLTYAFMRYFSAALHYTFIRYESERIGEDYDDHRLLLTLSWEQEWLRW